MSSVRDAFLANKKVTKRPVTVGDVTMTVRGMSVGERTRWERDSQKDPDSARARLMVMCCEETDGQPVFTDADVKAIVAMPAGQVEPFVDGIFECSGMTTEARDAVGKASAQAAGSETSTS